MYWTRADNIWGFMPWLLMSGLWWLGGVLISAYLFRIPARERLIAGLGTGILLYISLSNLVSHLAPFPVALWVGAASVLLIGLLATFRQLRDRPGFAGSRWPNIYLRTLAGGLGESIRAAWPQVLALAGLTYLFTRINLGLAIFDDYHNLPLVSLMAAGDVPPHFYLNTGSLFAYHYGWPLFAASLVRMGDLFPWGAFDFSKALSLALMAVLSWLWFRRWTLNRWGAFLGSFLAILGGGARWLLVLVSPERLAHISQTITLQGTSAASGPDLFTNLTSPWVIEGGGPLPFPFAFANGIFPSAVMALGGSGAIPLATLFLLLLLAGRRLAGREWNLGSAAVYSLLLATLGLTAEYLFAPLVAGLGLALLVGLALHWNTSRRQRARSSAVPMDFDGQRPAGDVRSLVWWLGILITGVVLAFASGGLLTEMLRRFLGQLTGGPVTEGSGFIGFALRWPPALVSAHLGPLSFTNPGQVLVGLAEIGPVLLLAPWASWWAWKQGKRGNWLASGLGLAALGGFLAPTFIIYVGRDRDITHTSGAVLFLWMVLAFPWVWLVLRRGHRWLRFLLATGYAVTVFGGLVLLAVQMLAIPRPQFTTFVDKRDAEQSQLFWNRLGPGAQILDSIPYRAITLFGAGGGRAFQDFFMPFPEWKALFVDPDPAAIARAGYSYVYIDQEWWSQMTREQKSRFKGGCVRRINPELGQGLDLRRLADVRACK